MNAPAGERLEPVEPGGMRDGDLVVRTSVTRGTYYGLSRGGYELRGPSETETWQRVVADPPLPTTPGTVIDATVDLGMGPVDVRLMRRAPAEDVPHAWLWSADQELFDGRCPRFGCHDRHIRPGWRQVYPEPGGDH